jgi:hypothetical protein
MANGERTANSEWRMANGKDSEQRAASGKGPRMANSEWRKVDGAGRGRGGSQTRPRRNRHESVGVQRRCARAGYFSLLFPHSSFLALTPPSPRGRGGAQGPFVDTHLSAWNRRGTACRAPAVTAWGYASVRGHPSRRGAFLTPRGSFLDTHAISLVPCLGQGDLAPVG